MEWLALGAVVAVVLLVLVARKLLRAYREAMEHLESTDETLD